jgi:uncharacterized protein
MKVISTPLTHDEVDQLGDFLDALPSPSAMNVEQLDGFFCALLVGPDLVMPSEYWPHVVGDAGQDAAPVFDSQEQAQVIMTLVVQHWNAINRTLQADAVYSPIFLEDENNVALGNDWATGFMHGVSLRQSSWQPLLDDETHASAILPMMALAHENDPDPALRFTSPTPEKREQMLLLMTAGIVQIYRYFAPDRLRNAASGQPFARGKPKPGRNEICACGSGKKYKHCCSKLLH